MKKYPFEKQLEFKDCGAACLSMIIKYYQGYYPLDELKEMTKTNKDGTTAYHLVNVLEEIGFDASGVECVFDDFQLENINLPCIANVIIDNSYKHFIVIYEINYKREYLIIGDPADRVKKIKFNDFKSIYNNVLILATPIKVIPIINNSNYKFLFNIVFRNVKLIKKLILLSIFLTVCSTISSFFMGFMINGVNYKSNNYLLLIFIVFFAINVLKLILGYLRNKVLIFINQRINHSLTLDVFEKIIKLPYQYYRNRTTGEMISRIHDLSLIKDLISKVALSLFIDLPLSLVALILLFVINYQMCFIAICILMLYLLVILIFKNSFNKNIKAVQAANADNTSFMVEQISSFETVKGLHLEDTINYKFKNKYFRLSQKVMAFQKSINRQNFFKESINDIGFMVIMLIGCYMINSHKLSLGTLLTFNMLLTYFLEPLKNIIDLDSEIKEAKSSLKRIVEVMQKPLKQDGKINQLIQGNILFKDLSYSFNDRDMVLKNINLEIKRSTKVMVVGRSGGGKSTLFKILMKYYDVDCNKVFLDDVDIDNISLSVINNCIVYINQNENLFNDTLYNNININNSDDQKFLNITKICHIDSIVNSNLGYNMIIEENGFNISGGERQRIALARTLLKPFQILIIDEGLSQVDVNLERMILKNIFNHYKDKTIIFISHRLDNVDLFDQLIEISDGKVIRNDKKRGIGYSTI